MAKFLDKDGLTHFWGKIKTLLAGKADKSTVDTMAEGFSVLSTSIDEKADKEIVNSGFADLEIRIESGLAGKSDTSHNHDTAYAPKTHNHDTAYAPKTHSHDAATTSENGFMTKDMVTKLNSIETGANKITVDTALSSTSTNPVQNNAIHTALEGKSDVDHSHGNATTSANGFMTKDMVTKLNGISAGANKTTVDDALSSTSTNPVQNKAIHTALAGKSDTSHNHDTAYAPKTHSHSAATTSANGFMTKDMVTKLNGIETGATKVTVDSALNSTSTNPVQNKAIYERISSLDTQINTKLSSVYFPAGSSATIPDLADVTTGAVYNMTVEFTTTADFIEGAGVKYPAGTNIVKTSDGKWDVLAGFVDLSPYAKTADLNDLLSTITTTEIDTMMSA